MDMAAEKLGLDPVELRLKNVKSMGERALQLPLESETLNKVIQQGAEKSGWKEGRSRNKENGTERRGIGMSGHQEVSGAQPHEIMDRHCVMSLEEDGSVTDVYWAHCGTNLLGKLCGRLPPRRRASDVKTSVSALSNKGRAARRGNGGKPGTVEYG